jgi:DTW domain-containing protein YfiP
MSERCPRCALAVASCLCADVPRVENRTEIILLRHVSEERRASNSGRLAALALARARVVRIGAHEEPLDASAIAASGTYLLFPEPAAERAPAPTRIVVLDGTWTQARRMRQRLPCLRGLPVLPLPARGTPVRVLRNPPHAGQLPTLVAIARALEALEGPDVAGPLLGLWDLAVDRMTADGRRPVRWADPWSDANEPAAAGPIARQATERS